MTHWFTDKLNGRKFESTSQCTNMRYDFGEVNLAIIDMRFNQLNILFNDHIVGKVIVIIGNSVYINGLLNKVLNGGTLGVISMQIDHSVKKSCPVSYFQICRDAYNYIINNPNRHCLLSTASCHRTKGLICVTSSASHTYLPYALPVFPVLLHQVLIFGYHRRTGYNTTPVLMAYLVPLPMLLMPRHYYYKQR
jgi:hypothetical protein